MGVPPSGYFALLKEHGLVDSELARISTGTFTSIVAGRIAHTFGFMVLLILFYKIFIYLNLFLFFKFYCFILIRFIV